MKKILALVAVVGLGLSTIGCEGSKPAPPPGGGAPAAGSKEGDMKPAPETPGPGAETPKEGEPK